jgi:hypothetical protein
MGFQPSAAVGEQPSGGFDLAVERRPIVALEPHIVVSRWRAFSAQTTDAEPLGFVGQVVLDAGTTAGIADVLSFIGKGAVRVRGAQRVESRHQEGER